jgi:hypothetical protein
MSVKRKPMRHIAYATFLAVLLAVAAAGPGWAGGRVALVIGNSGYTNVSELPNPKNDAALVAKALRDAGFDDVKELADLDQVGLRRALKDFTAVARGADTAVIYYAGHGVEVAGQNYLIPTDATLAQATDVEFEAIPLESARTAVSGARKLRLVIVDACRNNPFKLVSSEGKRSVGRGLARVEPNANELIAYAAKEGTVASDGNGANSPYATALVKYLPTPGLEIRLMFGQVRDEVVEATGGAQEPFTYGTLGGQPIYLNPAPAVAALPPPAASPPAKGPVAADTSGSQLNEAATAWVAVKDTTSIAVLKTYIARYKGTVFSDLAVARLEELQGAAPPPPAAVESPVEAKVPPVKPKDAIVKAAVSRPSAPAEMVVAPRVAVVGKWAEGAAFDGQSLWVAESGQRTIAQVDLNSGSILRRVTVGRLPVGMEATSDGRVYSLVQTDKAVWLQAPGAANGRRLAALKDCPQDIAVNDRAVWVLMQQDCSTADSRAVLINPQSGKQVQTVWLGAWGQALALGFGKVWVAHVVGGIINYIDAATLEANNIFIDGASFWDVATNSRRVFAGGRMGEDNAQGLIVAIDPATQREVARQSVDQMINQIVADDRSVVAVGLEGKIWVLSPETLAIERIITLNVGTYRPSDVLILGDQLVIVSQQYNGENGAVFAVNDLR